MVSATSQAPAFLPRERFDDLLEALRAGGRRVVGPTVDGGAIVFADLERAADLPVGVTLATGPGRARIETLPAGRGAARTFQYAVSGEGIKRFTFPSRVDALAMTTDPDGTVRVQVVAPPEPTPLAVIGARACDLAALAIHDRVLAGGPAVDPRLRGAPVRSPHRRGRVRRRLEHLLLRDDGHRARGHDRGRPCPRRA